MIRVFISTWSLTGVGITNPVVDYVDEQPNIGIGCSMYYPKRTVEGSFDKSFVVVVMRSVQDISSIATDIGNIQGVKLIPPRKLSTQLSSLSAAQRNAVRNLLGAYSIPVSLFDGSTTIGELLRSIVEHANPKHKFPFSDMDEEFA
jgi:hypothetical protein